MHFAFMIYGKKDCVDKLLSNMMHQIHLLPMFKSDGNSETQTIYDADGRKPDLQMPMKGQIRYLPFGFYEYVFPKEDLAKVLTTIGQLQGKLGRVNLSATRMFILRTILKVEPIPEFQKSEHKYYWGQDGTEIDGVEILPIGVRYDGEIIETESESKGYKHEAI